ncbi:hypothetical protein PTKIN_Ptkin14bG0175500 [Pterospermum kingtungense]
MKVLIQLYFTLCLQLLSFHFHVGSSLLSILSSNSSAPTQFCPHDQSYALLQFKNSLSIDASSSWCPTNKTISWKEGTNCCLWDGVKCESETGNVIGLDLSFSCLGGTIPSNSTLFHLHHLQELNLAHNDFSSSQLASTFGQFTNLTHLNISKSGFTGTAPLQISHLSKLLSLDLSYNYDLLIEGHVFEKLLGSLTQLQQLLLDGVNLSSVVPTSFLNISSYITTLTLAGNELQGKFPVDVFRFPCLQKFSLIDNFELEVNFPKSNWSSPLRSLVVSNVNASLGEVPDSIGNLRSLEVLDLSSSNLKGSIPASLGNLTQLFYLQLANNQFSGRLPFSAIFNLTQIESLDFSSNNLEGPLAPHVNGLSRLRELRLYSNFLSGKIPSWLFSLPTLAELWLSNNKLTGPIEQFDEVGPLEWVDLGNNEINGPIPSFSKFVNLTHLDLSSNKLNGIFDLSNLTKLESLSLSNAAVVLSFTNRSNGNYSFPNIGWLNLSSCNLSEFPDVVRNLQALSILDLSYNRIEMIEADMFLKLQSLSYLDLSSNSPLAVRNKGNPAAYFKSFKGIMHLRDVQMLYMQYFVVSSFPDGRPYSYGYSLVVTMKGVNTKFDRVLNIFTAIDMSSNNFEGKIPETVGNLTSLQVLNFSHNKLTGHIPSSFGDLAALESLDLSSNKLDGEIPMQLADLNFLEVLNLSENRLVGSIPQGKQFSTFANDSYVGNLGLCGFPLSKKCGLDEPPAPPVFHEESDSVFGLDWKFVMMGYGCGMVFGIQQDISC